MGILHHTHGLYSGCAGNIRQAFPIFTPRILQAESCIGRFGITLSTDHIDITSAISSSHIVKGYG